MALKLLPAKPCPLANSCSTLAISSPFSKIRAKTFGSSSICFHRMTSPFPKTISASRRSCSEWTVANLVAILPNGTNGLRIVNVLRWILFQNDEIGLLARCERSILIFDVEQLGSVQGSNSDRLNWCQTGLDHQSQFHMFGKSLNSDWSCSRIRAQRDENAGIVDLLQIAHRFRQCSLLLCGHVVRLHLRFVLWTGDHRQHSGI